MNGFAAAAAGGIVLALAFPPWSLDLLAWTGLVPLFWALSLERVRGRCALYGAVYGLTFFAIDMRWIVATLTTHGHFPVLPATLVFLLMVSFLSLYPSAFAYMLAIFRDKGLEPALVAPFLWIALEYVRSILFTGFPWDLLGYSQVSRPSLMQIADITGVYGVSFLVVMVNAALWEARRFFGGSQAISVRLLAAAASALILVSGYGYLRMEQFSANATENGDFTLGVLQGNIPQELKWERSLRQHTFETYETLGRKAVEKGAEALIWPETSAPVLFGSPDLDWKMAGDVAMRLGVPMVIGAPSIRLVNKEIQYYNSAFLLDGPMLRYRYDKMHLVPFGEYMPLSWLIPLGPGIAAREADYSPGETMTVMESPLCPRFSVLICYEAIFPELAREAVKSGADMLVNITNDGWFGDSAAPYQHLAMAGIRSIENRVWLIRAANTGISAAFDPAGRIVRRIPLQKRDFFVVKVSGGSEKRSFYCRFGDLFAWCCLVICGMLVLWAWRQDRSHGPEEIGQ